MLHMSVRRWPLTAALMLLLAAPGPLRAQERTFIDLDRALEAARSAATAWQRDRDGRVEESETVTRTVKLGPDGELDLSNISGDVSIAGGDGEDVRIEAVKRSRARSASEARQHLAMVEVQVAERPGRVEVRTEYPRDARDVDVSVTYKVTVPAATRTFVKSVSGDLRLEGTTGDTRLETVSGDVRLDARTKSAVLKTVSGSVEAANLAPEAQLTVSLVSGDLKLTGLRAQSVEAETVSGNLDLRDVTAQRVSVKSVSGDLGYAGSLAKGGRYEFTTHSGDVELTLSDAIGFELAAQTFSGDVRSALPVSGLEDEGGRRGPRRRSVRGTFGDGSAVLDLTTFSGDIVIARP